MPRPSATSPVDDLGQTLTALADPTRRAVIEQLRRGPARSGDLATSAGLSHPAMSRHLRVLRRASLVAETIDENDARVRWYRLHPAKFESLRGWLDNVAAFWDDQLSAFAKHVQAKGGATTTAPRRKTGPSQ